MDALAQHILAFPDIDQTLAHGENKVSFTLESKGKFGLIFDRCPECDRDGCLFNDDHVHTACALDVYWGS